MSKYFVAFLVFSVAGLSALNSVYAECKPGPDCSDCWCNKVQGYGCCPGFDCNSNFFDGVCVPTVCKGAPNCDDCWCDASLPCCEGYYCATPPFGSGVCRKGRGR